MTRRALLLAAYTASAVLLAVGLVAFNTAVIAAGLLGGSAAALLLAVFG